MPTHINQFKDPTEPHINHRNGNCTACACALGLEDHTGGRIKAGGGGLRHKLSNPEGSIPGVGLNLHTDMKQAWAAYGQTLENRTGRGWPAVESAKTERRGIMLQGDSDRFPNDDCSGNFNGTHCIYIPNIPEKIIDGKPCWYIHDSICDQGHWEEVTHIKSYAQKLSSSIFFAVTKPLKSQEVGDAMKFDSRGPVIGNATTVKAWHLWRVRDDVKTAPVPKNTSFQVFGIVNYHEKYVGYLVDYQGEAHVLPSKDVSTLKMVGEI